MRLLSSILGCIFGRHTKRGRGTSSLPHFPCLLDRCCCPFWTCLGGILEVVMSNRRIVALLKDAIQTMQGGHYLDAVLPLRHALFCVSKVFRRDDLDSFDHIDLELLDYVVNVPLASTMLDKIRSISPHNTFEVFTSAFSCPQETCREHFYTEIFMGLCYNVGLAHHLAGLSTIADSKKHLHTALTYYNMCSAVLQSDESECIPLSSCLYLGLLNNMGNIFCHFGMIEEARACTQHISTVLSSREVFDLSEDEMAFFAANALCGECFKLAPCA